MATHDLWDGTPLKQCAKDPANWHPLSEYDLKDNGEPFKTCNFCRLKGDAKAAAKPAQEHYLKVFRDWRKNKQPGLHQLAYAMDTSFVQAPPTNATGSSSTAATNNQSTTSAVGHSINEMAPATNAMAPPTNASGSANQPANLQASSDTVSAMNPSTGQVLPHLTGLSINQPANLQASSGTASSMSSSIEALPGLAGVSLVDASNFNYAQPSIADINILFDMGDVFRVYMKDLDSMDDFIIPSFQFGPFVHILEEVRRFTEVTGHLNPMHGENNRLLDKIRSAITTAKDTGGDDAEAHLNLIQVQGFGRILSHYQSRAIDKHRFNIQRDNCWGRSIKDARRNYNGYPW